MILEAALDDKDIDRWATKDVRKRLAAFRYKARRFVFDAAASVLHGRFAVDCVDLICENAEFAIPPFPNTYIEVDNRASIAERVPFLAEDVALRVGYLFTEKNDLYVIAGDERKADLVPFHYMQIDSAETHRSRADVLAMEPVDFSEFKRRLFIGQVAPELIDSAERFHHKITDYWTIGLTQDISAAAFRVLNTEAAGGLKRALAALLLLNQKRGVTTTDRPVAHRIINGKQRAYIAHSVVSIDLGNRPIRQAFHIENRASPRRHEVRGEFVHFYLLDGCTHQWQRIRDREQRERDIRRTGRPIKRWTCACCEARRTWRKAHERGDASKGFVRKQYEVTHREPA